MRSIWVVRLKKCINILDSSLFIVRIKEDIYGFKCFKWSRANKIMLSLYLWSSMIGYPDSIYVSLINALLHQGFQYSHIEGELLRKRSVRNMKWNIDVFWSVEKNFSYICYPKKILESLESINRPKWPFGTTKYFY